MKFEQQVAVEKPATAYPRPASIQADVVTPMLQALITGALNAALAVFVIGQLVPRFDAVFESWVGMSLAIAAAVWCLFLADIRRILYRIENSTGLDLDHDGMVGKPEERIICVDGAKITVPEPTPTVATSGFESFVSRLPSKGTGLRVWQGDIGRTKYTEYRDILLAHGLARWVNGVKDGKPDTSQGWELTTPVDVILKALK